MQPGRLVFALAVAIIPLRGSVSQSPAVSMLADSHEWIPLEDEDEIRRRQYPEYFPAALILPDLRTLPPSDVSLVVDADTGRKSIRFSNAVWNAGPGVLELHGEYDPEHETVTVVQVINREDGTQLERPAGEFHYHPDHMHIHWVAFSLYQIWSALPDGSFEGVRASSGKVGYCIRDIAPYEPSTQDERERLLNAPEQPGYTSCYWRRQGMSVGWYDIYRAHTSGQSLEITHLPDGLYALISTVDPTGILREADESNNQAAVYFRLEGDQIALLGDIVGKSGPRR